MMNDAGGFITLHRKMTKWEWYKDEHTKTLFLHLLLIANFRDTRFMGKKIRRGQIITSLPSLAAETGLSVQNVRTAIKHLISTGEITDVSTRQYRMITVVKYDDYQTLTDNPTDSQQTINRPLTDDQQHQNNDNNVNNISKRKREPFTPPSLDDVKAFAKEIGSSVDPERFFYHYEMSGWVSNGGRKMKDWKAAFKKWQANERGYDNGRTGQVDKRNSGETRQDYSDLYNGPGAVQL